MHEVLELREFAGSSPFSPVIGCAVGDSVTSRSRFSLPNVLGLTDTNASEDAVQRDEIQQTLVAGSVVGSRSAEVVRPARDEDDVPFANLSRCLRLKSRRKRACLGCLERGFQIQFAPVEETEVAGFSRRKCDNACLGPSCLPLLPKILERTTRKSIA